MHIKSLLKPLFEVDNKMGRLFIETDIKQTVY